MTIVWATNHYTSEKFLGGLDWDLFAMPTHVIITKHVSLAPMLIIAKLQYFLHIEIWLKNDGVA